MNITLKLRQGLSLWLAAMLMCVSFGVSAHFVEHQHEGANTHCTVCITQLQFNQTLPSTPLTLNRQTEQLERIIEDVVKVKSFHYGYYHSRAPPFSSAI
ncbi:ABC-type zinc uptake system zinc chaperone [Shewanella intestini]|uniref:ABC-type zinc uptake system zinc chaperone n=1 Tax=Shewanella intestini TaxID=2017544 RepID=A0ABS5I0N2_9GAMM|nr:MULTISPECIES: ABC-type zinc uptake system zinc chaperone [Shewanella]MBR9727588.1 ABC-type zinc uptake system zinc chaperone [Shewanella intestini]MRG35262.1 ABC-type zinc uptake system zinc chaperone [Shewanella sp. XMDDZSB0408]